MPANIRSMKAVYPMNNRAFPLHPNFHHTLMYPGLCHHPSTHRRKAIPQSSKATKRSMELLSEKCFYQDAIPLLEEDINKVFSLFGYIDEEFCDLQRVRIN